MFDPIHTLMARLEASLAAMASRASTNLLPSATPLTSHASGGSGGFVSATLRPASSRGFIPPGGMASKLAEVLGRVPPPGLVALLERYDGGILGPELRLLTFSEALAHYAELGRMNGPKGLWPVFERGHRVLALDAEAADEEGEEWPVVEIADRSIDRVGNSLLRFLGVVMAELSAIENNVEPIALAYERCLCDPGFGEHWIDLAETLDRLGNREDAARALEQGLRSATPSGPALAAAIALRELAGGDVLVGRAALEDALTLEALTARDDDARLDAAAAALVLALDDNAPAAEERARGFLGTGGAATGAFWRAETFRALGAGDEARCKLALRIVAALAPQDRDIERLRAESPASRVQAIHAAQALQRARDALDASDFEGAAKAARAAISERPEWGVAHATLAEALNGTHGRGALEAALRATELNPEMVDAWRELGDAYLEARDANKAEAAYRAGLDRDASYSLLHGKRAQALLELGRKADALQAVETATELGGDAFFLSAVRGDVLSALGRHREAAEAYDLALRVEPDNHWALHQAAIEHGEAGNHDRAMELFERALVHDGDGCHQTLVDYADLMRKQGRIGDAVRLYRRAVAAVPHDTEWRQWLREAEKELEAAPN